jgi:hypothetical protein
MTRYFLTLAAALFVSCTLASQAQTKTVLRSPDQKSPAFAGQLTPNVAPGPYNRGSLGLLCPAKEICQAENSAVGVVHL